MAIELLEKPTAPKRLEFLVDANCVYKEQYDQSRPCEPQLNMALLHNIVDDPRVYLADAAYSEIISTTQGEIKDVKGIERLEAKVLGKVDIRTPDQLKKRKINSDLLDRIKHFHPGRGGDYNTMRDFIMRSYIDNELTYQKKNQEFDDQIEELENTLEDGDPNKEIPMERLCAEQDRLFVAYQARSDRLKFNYLLTYALDASDDIEKPNKGYQPNVIYDAYVCALAHLAGVDSGKIVHIVSNDGDVSGSKAISDRMLELMKYHHEHLKVQEEYKIETELLEKLLNGNGAVPCTLADFYRKH